MSLTEWTILFEKNQILGIIKSSSKRLALRKAQKRYGKEEISVSKTIKGDR